MFESLRADIPRKPFYFVRHGETEANKQGILQGHLDYPLNGTGERQASYAADVLNAVAYGAICTSDLQRAHKTGQIIASKSERSHVFHILPELRERHFGIWQGVHRDEMQMARESEFADLEQGDSYREFTQRIALGLCKALQLAEPVVIVSHGGVFRAMGHLMGFEPIKLENAAIYKIVPHPSALGWNTERMTA